MNSQVRAIVIGDQLLSGVGDPRGMGWLARVIGRTTQHEPTMVLSSVIPNLTLEQLAKQWRTEFALRAGDSENCRNILILALGNTDVLKDSSIARLRLNLATVLDEARKSGIPVHTIGAPPVFLESIDAQLHHKYLQYERACQEVCQRRELSYISFAEVLKDNDRWQTDILASNWSTLGPEWLVPGQTGYGLMAWMILHYGWGEWLYGDTEALLRQINDDTEPTQQ